MAAETEKFIIAGSALWAGDFEFFEKLLRRFSKPTEVESIDVGAEAPEDFIRATGALRLRQLWQKRGEFKKLAREYARHGAEITDKPIIMETKHLRATLWRTDAREFLMQGYLKELSWQEGLFTQASHLAAAAQPTGKTLAPTRGTLEADDMLAAKVAGESFTRLGAAWTIAGNPFIQVELTDMGLIEATGMWTARELPDVAEAITEPFLKLLQELDASNTTA